VLCVVCEGKKKGNLVELGLGFLIGKIYFPLGRKFSGLVGQNVPNRRTQVQ